MKIRFFPGGGKKITSKDQFSKMDKVMQAHIVKGYNPLDLTNAVKYPTLN